jgi:hypothetical protein
MSDLARLEQQWRVRNEILGFLKEARGLIGAARTLADIYSRELHTRTDCVNEADHSVNGAIKNLWLEINDLETAVHRTFGADAVQKILRDLPRDHRTG